MTRHISDFKKNSLAIVLDLINADNGSNFTPAQVSLGAPAAGENLTTTIAVSAKVGSGFRGTVNVTYNRVPLAEVPALDDGQTRECTVSKLSDVLTFANAEFNMNLGVDDVTVNDVDLLQSDPAVQGEFDRVDTYTIAAKGTSLVWLDQVTLQLTPVRQELSEVWSTTQMDGLYPPGTTTYPEDAFMAQSSDGSIRTTDDGSIRIFAGGLDA